MAGWQGRNKLWFEFFVIKVWFANLVDGGGGGGGRRGIKCNQMTSKS